MKLNREDYRLYAVTDRAWAADEEAFFRQIEAVIDGGAKIIQLREKSLDPEAFLASAKRFVSLCREKGAVSIINDSVSIALASGADGVHVGQSDLEAGRVRELMGPDKLVGVSAHTAAEALRAQAAGADYLGAGAAFATGTKTDAAPISREALREIAASTALPVVAIGGISRENILELKGLGLSGAAVVSALFGQRDPRAAAAALLALAREL